MRVWPSLVTSVPAAKEPLYTRFMAQTSPENSVVSGFTSARNGLFSWPDAPRRLPMR